MLTSFRKPSAGPGQITVKISTPEDSILGSRKKVVCIWKTKSALTPFAQNKKEVAMGLETVSRCFRLRAAKSQESAP
jgi:hypothetical protein